MSANVPSVVTDFEAILGALIAQFEALQLDQVPVFPFVDDVEGGKDIIDGLPTGGYVAVLSAGGFLLRKVAGSGDIQTANSQLAVVSDPVSPQFFKPREGFPPSDTDLLNRSIATASTIIDLRGEEFTYNGDIDLDGKKVINGKITDDSGTEDYTILTRDNLVRGAAAALVALGDQSGSRPVDLDGVRSIVSQMAIEPNQAVSVTTYTDWLAMASAVEHSISELRTSITTPAAGLVKVTCQLAYYTDGNGMLRIERDLNPVPSTRDEDPNARRFGFVDLVPALTTNDVRTANFVFYDEVPDADTYTYRFKAKFAAASVLNINRPGSNPDTATSAVGVSQVALEYVPSSAD